MIDEFYREEDTEKLSFQSVQKDIEERLQAKLTAAEDKLKFLASKGLHVGILKDGHGERLAYHADPDSEFDGTIHINKVVHAEIRAKKAEEKLEFLQSKGLTVGILKDQNGENLSYLIEPGSELDDTEYLRKIRHLESELEDWKMGADAEARAGDEARAELAKAKYFIMVVELCYDLELDVYWNDWDGKGTRALINCNDMFFWGCADCEEIKLEDDEAIRKAHADSKDFNGAYLFIARKRKMRPQGAWYVHIDPVDWPLFDECGPERPSQLGNPVGTDQILAEYNKKQEEKKKKLLTKHQS
jgi:hypothetical protein